MTGDWHKKVDEIFLKACGLPESERGEFLVDVCGDDEAMRKEVESLLKFDAEEPTEAKPGSFSEAQATASPKSIGPYRIIGVLGAGGMGVVYEAEQENPHRRVALKVLPAGLMQKRTLRRFEVETEVLGLLQHPGIAQIFEAGMDDGQPYFAMELVDGKPLDEYVAGDRMAIRDKLDLFLKICDAIHHAHQKGVIHRDLKPANILVSPLGAPKVLDFGIARATDADIQATTQTDEGQLIGTLPYMSPEQATGRSQELDTRSDVYAVGVILHQMLTGRLPHDLSGRTLPEAVRIIQEDEITPVGTTHRFLRGDLEVIVGKALAKDRERRYASVAEFAEDLNRHLRDEPIVARPPSTWYQLRKFARRNKVVVAFVSTVFILLSLGLTMTLILLGSLQMALSFADRSIARALLEREEELWPQRPRIAPLMEQWLAETKDLLQRKRKHQEAIDTYTDVANKYEHERLLENLTALGELVPTVTSRLLLARTIEQDTVGGYEREWNLVIKSIASDPVYRGVKLVPQIGLVPLEKDPMSGFWEFWMPETGKKPERVGENLDTQPETGLVLILLPGGKFKMGGSRTPGQPYYHPEVRENEEPVHEVDLGPFFLSKFELTVGQWMALAGVNPSQYALELDPPHSPLPMNHPVENISWHDCQRVLRRVGLELPTEAQWEYSARAGTETIWWTGDASASLEGAENLADRLFYLYKGKSIGWPCEQWNDGHIVHSPVGTFKPNPFGLYDTLGNVMEWCQDLQDFYEVSDPRPGDGLRSPATKTANSRVTRGTSFFHPSVGARCSYRGGGIAATGGDGTVGVRPSRPILAQ